MNTSTEILNKNFFLIKEHIGLLKAANNFDIYDVDTGNIIMECREPNLGLITKLLRFTDWKRITPFDVQIKTADGQPIVRIQRGISIFLSKVTVTDDKNKEIGSFEQKFFSLGGKFDVQDHTGASVCQLEGKWTGWDFYFRQHGKDIAHVSKKWSGIGKELFTSADNYVLEIFDDVPKDDEIRKLVLAAVMCIDMVLKE